jgi:hypothetical protein
MKNLLFIQPLKPNTLPAYKTFIVEITGPRRKEYKELLKRYGLRTVKIWHINLNGVDYILVFHEAEDDALERLKGWPFSEHPFDLWFKEHLNRFYESTEQAHLLLEFDAMH